ncbi:MAG: MBL fold metallo-hydrolase [Candidatus Omnitrophota bacterium]
MILEKITVGSLEVNCYVLASQESKKAIVIDPGSQKNKILSVLEKHNLEPAFVINTHGHYDHIGCDDDFGVPVYAHREDVKLLRDQNLNLSAFFSKGYTVGSEIRALEDKELISLDDIELEVIHTPGHTPGGICLLMKKPVNNILFSGDTLFFESVGRTDFAQGAAEELIEAIKNKILVLPVDVTVYPGHGPDTSIGHEKEYNPFVI